MAETLKTEQTLLTGSIPAIASIEDPSKARMVLYQAGRPVHAPLDKVGLATIDMVVDAGGGDMAKAVYDTNNNGRVNYAESADSVAYANVTGKPSTFPPTVPIAQADVTSLVTDLALKAPLASPTFTGDAKAVTPATSDNDTSIATTAYVKAQGYAKCTVSSSAPSSPATGDLWVDTT